MKAEILTVTAPGGDAAEQGRFLSQELAAFGITVKNLTRVDGGEASLREALRHALSECDVAVICGGLAPRPGGPREAVEDVLGIPPAVHEDSLERIREYCENTGCGMDEEIRRQAVLPRGATVFPNEHGTAPGCVVVKGKQQVFLLPDSPGELLPMFSDYVAPYLTLMTGGTVVARTVGVFGLPASALAERLANLLSEANPGVSVYSKDGEAILRVTARAGDRASALALVDPAVGEIRRRLGVNVYGVDVGSLQKAVVVLLLDKGMKIATAESCTAGLLSSRLTEVAGASSVFECGVAAYSAEIKHNLLGVPSEMIEKFGTVSPEVAGAMAVGVRCLGDAALGVGITGVAGPDTSEGKPVGTVYIALADEKRVWVKKIATELLDPAADREAVRMLATSHALDLVRRYLEALPTVMAGGEMIDPEPYRPEIPEAATVAARKKPFFSRIFPWKGDGRGEKLRKIAVLAAFVILMAGLAWGTYWLFLRPMANVRLFRDLSNLYDASSPVSLGEETPFPEGMLSQFNALYARNADVRGWIRVEGTGIQYPVMRGDGEQYYASHNYDRQPSAYGVPYFGGQTAFFSRVQGNTSLTVYGNNTGDGQMFSDLTKYYGSPAFLREHPLVELNTLYQNAKWRIFAVLVAADPADSGEFDYARFRFDNAAEFLSFADEIRSRSLYVLPESAAEVRDGDTLLMLSTGFEETARFSGARLVVAARMLRPGEEETLDLSALKYNQSVVMPAAWRQVLPGGGAANSRRVTKPASATATSVTAAPGSEPDGSLQEHSPTGPQDSSAPSTASTTRVATTTNGGTTASVTGTSTEEGDTSGTASSSGVNSAEGEESALEGGSSAQADGGQVQADGLPPQDADE